MTVWRGRREMSCRQVVELLTDYLDGARPRADRVRLEAHLAACPDCGSYLEQIRPTIHALGRVEPDLLPPEIQEALVSLYRGWRTG